MTTLNKVFIIFTLIVIVLMICGVMSYKKGLEDGDQNSSNKGWVYLLVAIPIIIVIVTLYRRTDNLIKYEDAQIKLKNGYTAYIDGNEINTDKIDISKYQITINDVSKEIYLSNPN